jgi:hypothetical protein
VDAGTEAFNKRADDVLAQHAHLNARVGKIEAGNG